MPRLLGQVRQQGRERSSCLLHADGGGEVMGKGGQRIIRHAAPVDNMPGRTFVPVGKHDEMIGIPLDSWKAERVFAALIGLTEPGGSAEL